MSDHLSEVRMRLEWWRPAPEKILSATQTQRLIDDTAWLLSQYDAAGLASERAQVIRAALERWEDNPPSIGSLVNLDSLFALVADAHWLLGAVEAVRDD
ncbi:MAG: hypothetical protein RIS35_1470 [Pseudomonadota bacterium]